MLKNFLCSFNSTIFTFKKWYNIIGDNMKLYVKLIIGAVILGSCMAILFYKDIKQDVLALTKDEEEVSLIQVGAFKSYENALKYQSRFPNSVIYQDQNLARVILCATAINQEKLALKYQNANIAYYLKKVIINKDIYEEIRKYDEVIKETVKDEVIDEACLKVSELFLNSKT